MRKETFLASKWQHIQFLLNREEMRELIDALEPCFLFSTMGLAPKGKSLVSKEAFLEKWDHYVALLQGGKSFSDDEFRFFFTLVLTATKDAVSFVEYADKELVVRQQPLIQIQRCHITYAQDDNTFRAQVFGKDTISWGLQLSYPQLFQDAETRIVFNALDASKFVNAEKFACAKKWLRTLSVPVTFSVSGKKVKSTMRLGKQCFSWINQHPDLVRCNIVVER